MLNAASGQSLDPLRPARPELRRGHRLRQRHQRDGRRLQGIQYDDADVMVTGGTEAAMTPMGISGFANMKALSERNDEPQHASRPFDATATASC